MDYVLPLGVAAVALVSVLLSPRGAGPGAFFGGLSESGRRPGLLILTLSQVTTWIFARSLLNAAILGFYYGLWGTLAYAAYYLSFLTGGQIVDCIRFRQGFSSVQGFLRDRFGSAGTRCYNIVVGLRLMSEVFANLLVIGILFGAAGSALYSTAVVGFALGTLLYSMLGGLRASLLTDVFQMTLFTGLLALLAGLAWGMGHVSLDALLHTPFDIGEPGPVLLVVALLQIWSYPLHDPVMMDRGFLSDRVTTRRSFLHAAWISGLCIIVFGGFGVVAGANAAPGEVMNDVLTRLFGEFPMLLFDLALIVSAMSTLDSTLSSASKLAVVDMKLLAPTLANGRAVMGCFMLGGLALVFWGSPDLFSAVAVSGTASLYLAPVVFFSLWAGRRDVPVWSYLGSFALSLCGAAIYFLESAGHTELMGEAHKYTKLLWISATLMVGGCLLFWIGSRSRGVEAQPSEVPA